MQLRHIALATALLATVPAPSALGGPLGGIVGGHGNVGAAGMLGGDFGWPGPSLHSRARGALDGAARAGSGMRPRALDIDGEAEAAGAAAGRLRAPSGMPAGDDDALDGGALRGATPRHVRAAAEGAAEGGLGVMSRRAPVTAPAAPEGVDAPDAVDAPETVDTPAVPVTASRGVARALAGGRAAGEAADGLAAGSADGAARGDAAGGAGDASAVPARTRPALHLDAAGDADASGHADAGGARAHGAASGSASARVSRQ